MKAVTRWFDVVTYEDHFLCLGLVVVRSRRRFQSQLCLGLSDSDSSWFLNNKLTRLVNPFHHSIQFCARPSPLSEVSSNDIYVSKWKRLSHQSLCELKSCMLRSIVFSHTRLDCGGTYRLLGEISTIPIFSIVSDENASSIRVLSISDSRVLVVHFCFQDF